MRATHGFFLFIRMKHDHTWRQIARQIIGHMTGWDMGMSRDVKITMTYGFGDQGVILQGDSWFQLDLTSRECCNLFMRFPPESVLNIVCCYTLLLMSDLSTFLVVPSSKHGKKKPNKSRTKKSSWDESLAGTCSLHLVRTEGGGGGASMELKENLCCLKMTAHLSLRFLSSTSTSTLPLQTVTGKVSLYNYGSTACHKKTGQAAQWASEYSWTSGGGCYKVHLLHYCT